MPFRPRVTADVIAKIGEMRAAGVPAKVICIDLNVSAYVVAKYSKHDVREKLEAKRNAWNGAPSYAGTRTSPEKIERIKAAWLAGKSIKEIALTCETSLTTIERYTKDLPRRIS